ncbi:MAG: DUF2231 domain-containing protein [Gemmatimonadales bacterium]
MPNIGVYHPAIVHFAVALLVAGVIFRWISLTGRAAFTGPAAAVLLLAGTTAAVLAVKSGTDAHGPVERIPGAREAVIEHEEWGERSRNIFLAVAVLEILGLVLVRRNARAARGALMGSALVGVIGLWALYEAGEHGGDLVYRYAGGVGIRYGDTADVSRLYLAGLYHSAQQARTLHDSARAAELFGELARRFPDDTTVRFLAIESLIRDKNDGRAALAALAPLSVQSDNQRLRLRHGFLKVDAFLAAGRPDSARATLAQLGRDYPDVQRIKDRLAQIE